MTLSVILPVRDERENLPPLLDEISAVLAGEPHEIIAVDDGSMDGSGDVLHGIRERHPALRVLRLDRPRGQSAALRAGIEAAGGRFIVTLDADGQDNPADIRALLAAVDRGADAAVGYRTGRRHTRWKVFQSRIANSFRDLVTGDRVRDTGCALRVMPREAALRMPTFDGMHRFYPTLLRRQGLSVAEVPVAHRERRHGVSKYGMWDRLWRGIGDAFGVRWLIRRRLEYEVRERNDLPR